MISRNCIPPASTASTGVAAGVVVVGVEAENEEDEEEDDDEDEEEDDAEISVVAAPLPDRAILCDPASIQPQTRATSCTENLNRREDSSGRDTLSDHTVRIVDHKLWNTRRDKPGDVAEKSCLPSSSDNPPVVNVAFVIVVVDAEEGREIGADKTVSTAPANSLKRSWK